ncbi:MAG: YlbF family regulator [Clostridiales bacterium]|jgi:hypothetical protein|nr:YlbF family regulator [Clostridiales bacterium]
MTIHEKAALLAEEILASEASKDYADAWAAAEESPENKEILMEFDRLRAEYKELIDSTIGVLLMKLGFATGGCGGCGGRNGGFFADDSAIFGNKGQA